MTARSFGIALLAVVLAATVRVQPAVAQAAAAQPAATQESRRPAYLFVMGTTSNAEVIGRYARTLPPIYEKFAGRYLATGRVGRNLLVLEGSFQPESIVLAKFATPEGPNEFWWSPEYRQSAEMRQGAGIFDVVKLKGRPDEAAAPQGRPAYLISIARIQDRSKLKPYAEGVRPLLQAAGAKFLVSADRKDIELLEGQFDNLTVVIIQFPSFDGLRKFYDDPAYQALIPIRRSAGDYTLLAIDGFEPRN